MLDNVGLRRTVSEGTMGIRLKEETHPQQGNAKQGGAKYIPITILGLS